MIEDCESKGYPTPVWQSNSGATILTFKGVTVTSTTDDAVNDAVNDAVKRGVFDAVSDTVNDALSDAVKAVIASDNGVSINEIMNKTGKSSATVKRYLQILKAINFVEFKGVPKIGKYYITQDALVK